LARFAVRGSRRYEVKIDFSDLDATGGLRLECDCPHYDDGNACKHLWAAILKFDSQGLAKDLVPKTDFIDPVLECDDLDDLDHQPPIPSPYYRQTVPQNQRPKKPHWQVRLDTIRYQNRSTPPQDLSRSKNPRAAFYVLDLEETKKKGELVVQFYGQETTKSGKVGALKYMKVEREDVALYPDPLDKEAMAMHFHSAFSRADSSTRHP